MASAEKISWISVEDYLAGEKLSQIKHEYVDGIVYAMAGTSDRHNRIAGNFFTSLHGHLAEEPCEPFMESMKVRIDSKSFYYPDVLVSCEGPEADPYFRNEPQLIVEVTSPSTEQIDRTEKLLAYKQLDSLKEYVIVSQDSVRLDVYRRLADGRWEWELLTELSQELRLESVGLTLDLAQIYRRLTFPPVTSRPRVVPEGQ